MKRAFCAFTGFIVLSFLAMGLVLRLLTHDYLRNEANNRIERDLAIILTLTQGALAHNDYERIEEDVMLWGQQDPNIIAFRVILDGDNVLAEYVDHVPADDVVCLANKTRSSTGRDVVFEIVYDLTAQNREIAALTLVFLSLGGCGVAVFAVALWVILKRLAILPLQQEISERKRVQMERERAREFMQTVIDGIPETLMVINLDYTVALANRTLREMAGGRDPVASCLKCHDVSHGREAPHDCEKSLCPLEQVVESKAPVTVEHIHHDAQGCEIDMEIIAAPIFGDDGEVVQVIESCRDISERKRAEAALRESEQTYREIWDGVDNAICVHDGETGRPLDINERHIGMFGYTLDEFQQLRIEDFSLGPDEAMANMRAAASGEARRFEWHCRHKDGHALWIEVNVKRATIAGQDRVLAVTQDISERKEAEEALSHLRGYLANVIDSMPSVLVGVDIEGNVTQWNSEAQRVTGLGSEAAMGQPLARAFPRLAAEMERVREAMRTREVRSESRQPRKEDGETRYEDVTVYPLIANGVEGAVIRVDNVTDQVRIEEMMVQSEKMLSVGGLAAGMAHEINNPIGGMLQTASVMSDRLTRLDLPANVLAAEKAGTSMEAIGAFMESRNIVSMLGRIRESGSRAAEIVHNMLSFARKGDSTFSMHGAAHLLDQCVDLAGADYDLKKEFDFRQIEIVREYAPDIPPILCESGKIQQVLLNILRNGAQAMQKAAKGGAARKPRLVLRLAYERAAGMIRIEIEDNGPGMDEATRKRVFEPFFTTKPTGQGTGLGLSVSYFIITENHKGRMAVESQPGQWAKFIIQLPTGEESRCAE